MKELQNFGNGLRRLEFELSGGWSGIALNALASTMIFMVKWILIGFLVHLGWKLYF